MSAAQAMAASEGARGPQGPVADGERNSIYWWETESVQPRPPLDGEARADVCIVGGGYTGLWTACFLKQADPGLGVIVVERSWAGSGASGHNDGYAMTLLDMSLHHLLARHGPERAAAVHAAVARSVVEIGEFCAEHGIEAEYERNGVATVATNDAQRARLQRELEAAQRIGWDHDYELLEGEAARARIGSPAIRALLREGHGALLNPMKLVRGLARVAEERGVRIVEDSPALEVSAGEVRCERGTVKAERVVVATNAYQHALRPFRSAVVPIWSYAMVTEPLTEEQLGRVAWPGREGFEDARNYITIGRIASGNRILWGGRLAPYFWGDGMDERHIANERVFGELRDAWRAFFPMWEDVRFSHAYGGCVGITATFLPYVGTTKGGIHHAFGYNGHGVAPSHAVAGALADLVLGRDSDRVRLPFVDQKMRRMPPEPLRFLGARLTTRLLRRQDRRMDAGREAGDMDPLVLRLVNRL